MSAASLVCRNCSATIVRDYGGTQCPFCLRPWNALVLREKGRPQRKVKKGGWNNTPRRLTAIGHRDGWVCYLCGNAVAMPGVLDDNHPDAPSCDHVLPLSLGGKHQWANLALTHRRCNSNRKSQPLSRDQTERLLAIRRRALVAA